MITVRNPVLWFPGQGNLYDLRLRVPGESGYRARVGLRVARTRPPGAVITWSSLGPLALLGVARDDDLRGPVALTAAPGDSAVATAVLAPAATAQTAADVRATAPATPAKVGPA